MSSDGGKRKQKEEDEEESVGAVSSDNDKDRGTKSDEIERKRKLQNKVRCKRYRDKRKRDKTITSRIRQHRAITVEEEIIIKRRKEYDKQRSKRYRDKKRAANLINLQTDQPSKTIAKHVPELQNFHTSQIPGPSTRNVPYIAATYTPNAAGLSVRNELFEINIPISYSDYNTRNAEDGPATDTFVEVPVEVAHFTDFVSFNTPEPGTSNTVSDSWPVIDTVEIKQEKFQDDFESSPTYVSLPAAAGPTAMTSIGNEQMQGTASASNVTIVYDPIPLKVEIVDEMDAS